MYASDLGSFVSTFSLCAASTAAALMVGAALGFLFGLPRVPRADEDGTSTSVLLTNTNLDQVSDWVTKILVGLGLVELGKLSHDVNRIALSLAAGLGGHASAHDFAFALLVYAAIDGFLVGYLWTRIVVSIRLKEATQQLRAVDQVLTEPLPPSPPPAPPSPTELRPEG